MSTLATIIVANIFISLLSITGVIFALQKKSEERLILYAISFAAGVMLTTVFVNILPEAAENQGSGIYLYVLLGMIVSFFLERSLLWYHHHHNHDHHQLHPSTSLILIGDGIHNFIDGLAIAATFLVNPAIGFTTAIAIAAHEIPQELADLGVLIHFGMKKTKAIIFNLLSALTAVLGGIFGYYYLQTSAGSLSPLLAITSGVFIYIASADLIPELHRHHKKQENLGQSFIFIFGVILMFIISRLFSE